MCWIPASQVIIWPDTVDRHQNPRGRSFQQDDYVAFPFLSLRSDLSFVHHSCNKPRLLILTGIAVLLCVIFPTYLLITLLARLSQRSRTVASHRSLLFFKHCHAKPFVAHPLPYIIPRPNLTANMDQDQYWQWLAKQQADGCNENANIDPRLLNMGSGLPDSGERHDSVEQLEQDVDRSTSAAPATTHAGTAPGYNQPEQRLQLRTPPNRHHTCQAQQQMLATPGPSSHSQQNSQRPNAYQDNAQAGPSGSSRAPSNLDITPAQMPQHPEPGAQGVAGQYDYRTPVSQHTPHRSLRSGNGGMNWSPSMATSLPHPDYGRSSQVDQAPTTTFQPWGDEGSSSALPTEDIPAWVNDVHNLLHPNDMPVSPSNYKGKGKGRALETPSQRSKHSGRSRRSRRSARSEPSSDRHACDFEGCKMSFPTKGKLKQHARKHEPPTCKCPLCKKMFTYNKDVKRHLKTKKHWDQRDLFCHHANCPYHYKGFQRRDHLVRHLENFHGEKDEEEDDDEEDEFEADEGEDS